MQTDDYGAEIFFTNRSIRLAVIWTAIFALPVLVILESYAESKNVLLLFFALLLLLPALYLFTARFTDKLMVFEHAIVLKQLFGTKAILLDENAKIYVEQISDRMYGLPVARHTKIRIINHGEALKIPSGYQDLEGVLEYLEWFQQQVIYPACINALENNVEQDFGVIKVKKNGIIFKKKVYRWEEISSLEMEAGFLRLFAKEARTFGGANVATQVKDIANLSVLAEILSKKMALPH